ncbi:MAG: 4-alpha-glucanotransferase [Anaerolineales bacterium]|nr:4-alpha-glucanotransferase [Anaerolineales bacterium]
MNHQRKAGILLHPTSLPGPYGIGDLGPQARAWLDFLAAAGQTVWQILPLSPAGWGNSPYQALSDFAGNPLWISPEDLLADGLLSAADIGDPPRFAAGPADFIGAREFKSRLLRQAHARLRAGGVGRLNPEFERFREEEKPWLEDFCTFLALKRAHADRPWWEWERDSAFFLPDAVRRARANLAEEMEEIAFEQFLFRRQWEALREHARRKGILVLGDLPMYCALDSAEVWSARRYFQVDRGGLPSVQAGVPPDYFSPTGQLWGNPIFDWEKLQTEGFAWWIRRARAALDRADLVRLDHFRGYAAYWAVPAGRATAEDGRWLPGPGEELFARLRQAIGGLPFLAEDLGVITEDVVALRERLRLPGMAVLQFAFDGKPENPFLPDNIGLHTAAYTGTHDNDTILGWYRSLSEAERRRADRYRPGGGDVAWDFIRLAWESAAETAVCPLQDLLGLGAEARMNRPGRAEGNWGWRFRGGDLRPDLAGRLRELTGSSGRMAEPAGDPPG